MSTVDKFLGLTAADQGPFGLLGIPPEQCTNVGVIAALERQLDRIDQHPQGDTPEAEELRLALHAAAAQLLDPIVRRHLIQQARPDLDIDFAAMDASPVRSPASAARDPAVVRAVGGLEQDAILTMARFGGINPASMRRLAALAHARGLDSGQAAQALQQLARRRPMNVDRPTQASSEAASGPQLSGASVSPETAWVVARARQARARQAAIVGGLLLLSLVSLTILVGIVLARRPAPDQGTAVLDPSPPKPQAGDTDAPAPDPAQQPSIQKTPSNSASPRLLTGGPEILQALRKARSALDEEPGSALDDFLFATRSLAAAWPDLGEGERRAAHHAVLEFLYAASAWPDISEAAFDLIAAPAGRLAAGEPALEPAEVAPALWSVGMLARLTSERELPVRTTRAIRDAMAAAIGGDRAGVESFEAGARTAAAMTPLALVRPERLEERPDAAAEGVKIWHSAIKALYATDADRERALVDGLERILIEGAEPTADRRVLTAIRSLVPTIGFVADGPGRPRVVDWFRHPRVSADDLAEVTGAMAASAVEGVDSMMVLSRSAGRDDRLSMAAAYAAAWSMEQVAGGDEIARQWVEAARQALLETEASADPVDALARAVRFARLNEVARRLWRGERSGLAPLLEAAASNQSPPPGHFLVLGQRFEESSLGTDGQWALEYRAARQNIPVRLELLQRMERVGGAIGPLDAEVLAEEAFFGTPSDRIRSKAQELVVQFSSDPAMVLAVLEVLPRRRKILPDIARMVASVSGERLGAHEDPLWGLRARRALVQRSLELLAPQSRYSGIDPLVAVLSSSYERRAGVSGGGAAGPVRASIAAEQLIVAARELWDVVLVDADAVAAHDEGPIARSAVERRRRGRQALARGPMQMFVAEQVSIAELLAWTVAGEQRSRAEQVRTIMDDLTRERQAARHIFQQVEAAERTMLQFWLIRFGEEQPS